MPVLQSALLAQASQRPSTQRGLLLPHSASLTHSTQPSALSHAWRQASPPIEHAPPNAPLPLWLLLEHAEASAPASKNMAATK
jgi:hypothetical protein